MLYKDKDDLERIVDVPFPHLRLHLWEGGSVHQLILQVLHVQIAHRHQHRAAHQCAKDLLVKAAVELEICGGQHEF